MAGRSDMPGARRSLRSGSHPALRIFRLLAFCMPAMIAAQPASSQGTEPVRLNIVGGFAAVNQYTRHEQPFWQKEIRERSSGRILAEIRPFDRSGIPGSEMLPLMKAGVVPFGNALVSLHAGDDPEIAAIDMPALSPDIQTLRITVAAFRPRLKEILKTRYNVELLAVYILPAQVVFCAKPFASLADLAGRRIRTSSVAQSEIVAAINAIPVRTAFSETVSAVTKGVVDCAITGTMSANEIGLSAVTTHMHSLAITWGVSIFGANSTTWAVLPEEVRNLIASEITGLESRIWLAAERETANGVACNTGAPNCQHGRAGRMVLVPHLSREDDVQQHLLRAIALPRWIERCGPPCIDSWNQTIGPVHGLIVLPDRTIARQTPGKAP